MEDNTEQTNNVTESVTYPIDVYDLHKVLSFAAGFGTLHEGGTLQQVDSLMVTMGFTLHTLHEVVYRLLQELMLDPKYAAYVRAKCEADIHAKALRDALGGAIKL